MMGAKMKTLLYAVRCGSFNNQRIARCAYRDEDIVVLYDNNGFRVCASPISPAKLLSSDS
jgi:hypothetical protein